MWCRLKKNPQLLLFKLNAIRIYSLASVLKVNVMVRQAFNLDKKGFVDVHGPLDYFV